MPSPPLAPTLSAITALDRASPRRGDAAYLAALAEAPGARVLVLVGDKVVIRSNPERTASKLAAFHPHEVPGGSPTHADLLFLGVEPGTESGVFALALSPEDAGRRDPTGTHFAPAVDIRSLAMQGVLTLEDLARAATAAALAGWHLATRFCGHCGGATGSADGGWKRVCTACRRAHFPRTDPVVIMLVTAGDRCVLARQPHFPEGMVSALAGFVEPGETIESAVARETEEEIGLPVAVERVRYVASQPWPFPHSLMIGCIAETGKAELRIDTAELEAANWYSRGEVGRMLMRSHPQGLWVPGPHAIAHWLAARFAEGTL